LNTGVWFRRGRLLIVSPVRGHHRRYQAETPLIPLSRFAEPALIDVVQEYKRAAARTPDNQRASAATPGVSVNWRNPASSVVTGDRLART
jgi:hypothetical protein